MPTENTMSALHRSREISMRRVNGAIESEDKDFIAAEEPLEIRVEGHSIAVVMRTPGEDRELAAGFLLTEGMIRNIDDVKDIRHRPHCWSKDRSSQSTSAVVRSEGNVIDVWLKNPASVDLQKLSRHVFTSSSCGICSKASIEAVRQQFPPLESFCEVDLQVILELPGALSTAQETFKRTGGL